MKANLLDSIPGDATLIDPGFDRFEAQSTTSRTTVLPHVEVSDDDVMMFDRNMVRYETMQRLGAGGGGEVLLVKDNDIQRNVALKRLRSADQGGATLARFLDEIRTVGQLDHPNIVPIHDVGIDEKGCYFFVMKHLQGETLDVIIRRLAAGDPEDHRRFTFEYRTSLFLQILRAIQFAHAQGILHRDIKPSNIMIGHYGEVVVMDWGIAKRVGTSDSAAQPAKARGDNKVRSSETRVGALVGTPAYMSPEQVRGDNHLLDTRTDIYSLCVLFYEMLVLRHYLPRKTSIDQVLAAVLTDVPVPPYRVSAPVQGNVPLDLWYFIERGLQKRVEDRWQSVTQMIDALQRIVEGKYCVACPVTGVKRSGRAFLHFVDDHPVPGVLLCLLLGLLCVYGALHAGKDLFLALRHVHPMHLS